MQARLAAIVLLLAVDGSAYAADTPSRALAIKGNVANPSVLTVEALRAMPQLDVAMPAPDGTQRTYRGVLLRDVLAAAKPIETGRFDLRQSIVVTHATDGSLAVFTWVELFNSPIGDDVLVAWSLNGAPLGDGEGSLALVSARDTRAGPRPVRWLVAVDLRRVRS
jgi:DMSO/TMAO reductase YedYZ molybdopterin-dependent catalytic subunit